MRDVIPRPNLYTTVDDFIRTCGCPNVPRFWLGRAQIGETGVQLAI
jgi:hypothetical protein